MPTITDESSIPGMRIWTVLKWRIHLFSSPFLCHLRSIAAHREHFVRRLFVRPSVCLSRSHTFLVVTHSFVSQATHEFIGMLPLCFVFGSTTEISFLILVTDADIAPISLMALPCYYFGEIEGEQMRWTHQQALTALNSSMLSELYY